MKNVLRRRSRRRPGMVRRLQSYWHWLSGLGLSTAQDAEAIRITTTLNRVAFIAGILVLPYALPQINPTENGVGWIEIVSFLGFMAVIAMNGWRGHRWGAMVLVLTANLKVFFSASYRGVGAGEQLFFIPLLVGLILIYDLRKHKEGWALWGLSLGNWAGLELTNYELMARETAFAPEVIRQIFTTNLLITMVILLAIAFYYSRLAMVHRAEVEAYAEEQARLNGELSANIQSLSLANEQLRRQEQALIEARDKAEAGNRAKSEFLGVMSHELRTPLHAAISALSLLRETDLTEEQRDLMETARGSSENLFVLLDNILNLARFEKGQLQLQADQVTLPDPLLEVVDRYREAAKTKGLALVVATAEAKRSAIEVDRLRLRQILSNLLSNAVKFTDEGSIEVGWDCTCDPRASVDSKLRIWVRDTGVGIPAAMQEELFRPFVLGDSSTTRKHAGTGLGLAVVYALVTVMGGDVRLKSEIGRGTEISLTLPVRVLGQKQRATDAAKPGQDIRVLVVEDHPVNQKVARTMLSKLGYQFDLAANGREALRAFGERYYDLVLMDLQMPEMDGITATRYLREQFRSDRQPVIIAMTANTTDKDRAACENAGMNDFLAKPVRKANLQYMIEKWRPAPAT